MILLDLVMVDANNLHLLFLPTAFPEVLWRFFQGPDQGHYEVSFHC